MKLSHRIPLLLLACLMLAGCQGPSSSTVCSCHPVSQEPAVTETITTDLSASEPVTSAPTVTEPITTEPITSAPTVTEPITTEPEETHYPKLYTKTLYPIEYPITHRIHDPDDFGWKERLMYHYIPTGLAVESLIRHNKVLSLEKIEKIIQWEQNRQQKLTFDEWNNQLPPIFLAIREFGLLERDFVGGDGFVNFSPIVLDQESADALYTMDFKFIMQYFCSPFCYLNYDGSNYTIYSIYDLQKLIQNEPYWKRNINSSANYLSFRNYLYSCVGYFHYYRTEVATEETEQQELDEIIAMFVDIINAYNLN